MSEATPKYFTYHILWGNSVVYLLVRRGDLSGVVGVMQGHFLQMMEEVKEKLRELGDRELCFAYVWREDALKGPLRLRTETDGAWVTSGMRHVCETAAPGKTHYATELPEDLASINF